MEPSLLLQIVATAMTVSLIVFALALLIAQRTERRDQRRFLAGFLFIYLLSKANALFYMLVGFEAAPILAGLVFPTTMLLGPAVYFYARSTTSPVPRPLGRRDVWALAGPLVLAAIISEFYFWSTENKLLMYSGQFTPEISAWLNRTCKLIFLWFLVFSIGCLAAAFRLLLRHTERVRNLFSNIEDRNLDWLRWILLTLAAGWAWHVASSLWAMQGGKPAWIDAATAYFEFAWISAISFFGVQQRPVYGGADAPDAAQTEAVRYARSALGDERMTRIAANLERAMTRDKLFADPTLSLRALSGHLGVSEYYVSQTLNEKMGVNFFDFVNRSRIDEACRRLETTSESIQAITHAVGFNSRSTFNAAFKKHVGSTPSHFRRSAVKSDSAEAVS